MNAKYLAMVAVLVLAPAVAVAIGPEVERVTPPNRPYIVEVGSPQPLSSRGLDQEMRLDSDLKEYLQHYGWPDYAEVQEIEPNVPWAAYEVRIYYLKRNVEIAFGRAFISPSVTNLGVLKYQGLMDQVTRDRIVALATPPQTVAQERAPVEVKPVVVASAAPAPEDEIEMLVRRVEAAADRASAAADRAADASQAATTAADRTVTILEKVSQ
jgi:hypothetical protein